MRSEINREEYNLVVAIGERVREAGFPMADCFETKHSTEKRPVFAAVAVVGEGEVVGVGGHLLGAHLEIAKVLEVELPSELRDRVARFQGDRGKGERNRHDSRLAVLERLKNKNEGFSALVRFAEEARVL